MRTPVPEKLLAIVEAIEAQGNAKLIRLTVLKQWFEHPGRSPAFGLWTAKRAAGRKGRTKAAAGALLDDARALLGPRGIAIPNRCRGVRAPRLQIPKLSQ